MRNIMSLCLTFFFFRNKKKTYESERLLQFVKNQIDNEKENKNYVNKHLV